MPAHSPGLPPQNLVEQPCSIPWHVPAARDPGRSWEQLCHAPGMREPGKARGLRALV